MTDPSYQRGTILYRQQRFAQAAEEFRRAIAQADSPQQSARSHAMLALSLHFDGDDTAAFAAAGEALSASPNEPFVHYALASIQIPRRMPGDAALPGGHSLDEYRKRLRWAKPAAGEAVRLSPTHPDYLALLSSIELDLANPKAALELADRGLATNPRHVSCGNLRARALVQMGDVPAAEAEATRVMQVDPENARSHRTRGWVLLHAGAVAAAQAHFDESLRLDPNDVEARRGMVMCYKCRMPGFWWIWRLARWLAAHRAIVRRYVYGWIVVSVAVLAGSIAFSPNRFFPWVALGLALPLMIFVAMLAASALYGLAAWTIPSARRLMPLPDRAIATCGAAFLAGAVATAIVARQASRAWAPAVGAAVFAAVHLVAAARMPSGLHRRALLMLGLCGVMVGIMACQGASKVSGSMTNIFTIAICINAVLVALAARNRKRAPRGGRSA